MEIVKFEKQTWTEIPKQEQYKELDELMTYILDEMWVNDDKGMIREAIIAYANKWNEVQANGVNTGASTCNIPLVSNSLVADIRNKLTPPKNLCAMIKNLPRPLTDDTDLNNLILKVSKQNAW